MKITAFELKLAFMEYYRFRRQAVVADEFNLADVIADTGKEVIEVEVKVSKYDLLRLELKKQGKHNAYRHGSQWNCVWPNRFLFGVTEDLVEDAKELIQELNPKYGIIAFNSESFQRAIDEGYYPYCLRHVRIAKSAKKLHDNLPRENHIRAIAARASCKAITLMQDVKNRVIDEYRKEGS